MNPGEEVAYEQGVRRAHLTLLGVCLKELGYTDGTLEGIQAIDVARLIKEREETVQQLRTVCADHGDNDWKPDAYLPDVIDKHLADHLNA